MLVMSSTLGSNSAPPPNTCAVTAYQQPSTPAATCNMVVKQRAALNTCEVRNQWAAAHAGCQPAYKQMGLYRAELQPLDTPAAATLPPQGTH